MAHLPQTVLRGITQVAWVGIVVSAAQACPVSALAQAPTTQPASLTQPTPPPALPPELRAALHHADAAVRVEAVRGLAPYGQAAVGPLFAMLEDAQPGVRWAALGTLNSLEHADLVPDVMAALPKADARMQVRLYFLLARHADRRAWKTLVEGLQHTNPVVRQTCADGVIRAAQAGDEAVLGAALGTAEPAVALGLVQALAMLRTPEAVEALATLLENDDAVLRQYAAQGLADTGQPAAVAHLAAHRMDPAPEVRSWVYYGISQHGDLSTFDILHAGATDDDPYVRQESVWGLGRLGDVRALPALRAALDDPKPEVRRSAVEALGMLDTPEALPDVRRAGADPNASVRLVAAAARLRLGDPSAAGELIEQLSSTNRQVRQIALRSLTLYSGQSFGTDAEAWRTWWKTQQAPAQAPGAQVK